MGNSYSVFLRVALCYKNSAGRNLFWILKNLTTQRSDRTSDLSHKKICLKKVMLTLKPIVRR